MWKWLRTCAECGQLFFPVDLLCEECWRQLFARIDFRDRHFSNYDLHSLWTWGPRSRRVETMIHARKSPVFDEAHQRMVDEFLRRWQWGRPSHLVYPTQTPHCPDHAFSLARAFARRWQIPLAPVTLSKENGYKLKGAKDRYQTRKAELGCRVVGHQVWMIDDVLTSGATAEAVWRALGKPLNFRVITLAYKQLVATGEAR